MAPAKDDDLHLEIGHVLFIDLVGYSQLLIDEQRARLRELTEIVQTTPQVRAATNEKLVRLPTGDGMALVFRNSAEEPVECAVEIARALKNHPAIAVRMGVHSGPVSEVTDLNERTNVAGAGINMAQRVMDCGDAGHILLSQRVAGDLEQYRQWRPALHDLGECEVKHGVRLHVVNFYREDVGNPAVPQKFRTSPRARRSTGQKPGLAWVAVAAALTVVIGAAIFFLRKTPVTPAVVATLDKSVAVIPLVNTSGDPNNEYFSDGLSEELIAVLSKISGLKVIGRGSSFLFKGKSSDSAAIGQKLGVAQLIEGSVRKQDDRVRIVASLIKASDGQELWSETYDRSVKDIFAVQSEIAQAVAAQLKVKLLGEKPVSDSAVPDLNSAAYDAVLKSKFAFGLSSEAGTQQAIKFAEEATRLDPNYAPAWAALSQAWRRWAASFATRDVEKGFATSRMAVEKAVSLDPNSVEALVALSGVALNVDFDFRAGEKYARRAIELAPGDANASRALAGNLFAQGRLREAKAVTDKIVSNDPLEFDTWYGRGILSLGLGDYQDAEKMFLKALEIQPQAARVHARFVDLNLLQGDLKKAQAQAELEPEGFWRDYARALVLQKSNEQTAADEALRGMIEKYSQPAGFQIATLYALRHQADEMFQWLEKSFTNRDGGLSQLFASPYLMQYRDDPRFAIFCRKLGIDNLPPK